MNVLGYLSVVDEAIFVESKAKKRVLHLKSTKYPSRTLLEDVPECVDVEDFNLTEHIEKINAASSAADEFEL